MTGLQAFVSLYDKTRVKGQLAVCRSRICYFVFVQIMD